MRDEGAGMTRCTAEWSVKGEGVEKAVAADLESNMGEGVESK
jgi:hypothetical protein